MHAKLWLQQPRKSSFAVVVSLNRRWWSLSIVEGWSVCVVRGGQFASLSGAHFGRFFQPMEGFVLSAFSKRESADKKRLFKINDLGAGKRIGTIG